MSVPCTKEVILTLIEDIELIARELLENAVAPKQKRMAAVDHKVRSNNNLYQKSRTMPFETVPPPPTSFPKPSPRTFTLSSIQSLLLFHRAGKFRTIVLTAYPLLG